MTTKPPPATLPRIGIVVWLVLLGTCGLTRGVSEYSVTAIEPPPSVETAQPSAFTAGASHLAYTWMMSEWRRPLGLLAALISLLLIWGGVRVARRSPDGRWWASQALLAKLVLVTMEFGLQMRLAFAEKPKLYALAESVAAQGGESSSRLSPGQHFGLICASFALSFAIGVAIFSYVLWRVRQEVPANPGKQPRAA